MIRKILIVATLAAIPTLSPIKAQAKEYCREYTKTISVGGRAVQGYGTACRQRDGSWEVVKLEGSARAQEEVREVIYEDLNDLYDNRRTGNHDKVVIVERSYKPYYRSSYYHSSYRSSHHSWPVFFGYNSHYGYHDKSAYRHHKKRYYKKKHYKHHKDDGHHDKKYGKRYGKSHKKNRH